MNMPAIQRPRDRLLQTEETIRGKGLESRMSLRFHKTERRLLWLEHQDHRRVLDGGRVREETISCSGLQARSFYLILNELEEIKQQT